MTAAEARPRRRVKWWGALVLVAAATAAWLNAPWIVERLIVARLTAAGAAVAAIDVRRVGLFETLIEDVRIAGPTSLAADRAIVRYTPWAALRGELYSITLEGLVIAGGAADAAATGVRVERWLRSATDLRVDHVEFGEARVTLEAPGGAWNATLRGHLVQTASRALDGAVSIVATSVAGAFGGELRLAPDEVGRTAARLAIREGVVRLPGLTLEALSGEISVGYGEGAVPAIEIDLQTGGRSADGGGIERARLRVLAEGSTVAASLAGIDLDGRRLTVETAFDAAEEDGGLALRPSRPGSVSFLDRPARGATPLGVEARIVAGAAPTLRLLPLGEGYRLVHAVRIELRPTTIATPLGPAHSDGGNVAIDGALSKAGARGGATATGLRLTLPQRGLRAEDVAATLRWDEMPPRLEIKAARLVSLVEPALFPPLALELSGEPGPGGLAFRARAGDDPGRLAVEAEGTAASDGSGSARIRLRPVDLGRDGALGQLSPALAAIVRDGSGTFAGRADLAWSTKGLDGSARLLLRDIGATLPFGRVARVNGVVALDGLWPPSTSGVQTLTVGVVDVGLPLTDGTIGFRLDRGRPVLVAARFAVAGGLVTLTEATLSPAFDAAVLTLEAAGLDAGLLAAAIGVDGLTAEGRISGTLPVRIDRERVSFAGSALTGVGAGRVVYRPQGTAPAFRGDAAGEAAAPDALAGARWEDIRLAIDHPRGAAGPVGRLTAAGGGVDLAFDLAGRLDRYVRETLGRYRVPEETQRRMREYGEP
ncbi:MAG: YdbH domain-containing protein [Alphaproteobacteria bacterium]|nr:YdbH domain-containing protein [Alphaproteobacteria bacterium]